MIKMARICDICGRVIGTYNSRYTLTYKSVLYSIEKDICPLCVEKLREQSKEHKIEDEPQNGYQTFNGTSVYISRVEDEPQTDCAWKKGAE